MHRDARIGHWWIDSATGSAVRLRWVQAHIWTRVAIRIGGVRVVARPDRAVHEGRARRGDFAERDQRARSDGFDEHSASGARLYESARWKYQGAEARVTEGIYGRRAGPGGEGRG